MVHTSSNSSFTADFSMSPLSGNPLLSPFKMFDENSFSNTRSDSTTTIHSVNNSQPAAQPIHHMHVPSHEYLNVFYRRLIAFYNFLINSPFLDIPQPIIKDKTILFERNLASLA